MWLRGAWKTHLLTLVSFRKLPGWLVCQLGAVHALIHLPSLWATLAPTVGRSAAQGPQGGWHRELSGCQPLAAHVVHPVRPSWLKACRGHKMTKHLLTFAVAREDFLTTTQSHEDSSAMWSTLPGVPFAAISVASAGGSHTLVTPPAGALTVCLWFLECSERCGLAFGLQRLQAPHLISLFKSRISLGYQKWE